MHTRRIQLLERCAIVVLGLYLAGTGLRAMSAGRWVYANYLRAAVAAPMAIAIGAALIVAALVFRH